MRFKNLTLEIVIAEGDKSFTTVLREQSRQMTATLTNLYDRYIESRYCYIDFDLGDFDVQTPLDFYFKGKGGEKNLRLFHEKLISFGWKSGQYTEEPSKPQYPQKPIRVNPKKLDIQMPKGLSRKKKKSFKRAIVQEVLQDLQGELEMESLELQVKTQYSRIRLWTDRTEVYLHQEIPVNDIIREYKDVFSAYIHLMPNQEKIESISFFFEHLLTARRFIVDLILGLGWIDPYDVDQKCPGLLGESTLIEYYRPEDYDDSYIPF